MLNLVRDVIVCTSLVLLVIMILLLNRHIEVLQLRIEIIEKQNQKEQLEKSIEQLRR